VFYEAIRVVANAYFLLFHGYRSYHSERVPAEGPLLLVCNHQSFYDPPAVGCGVRNRQLSYLARSGLFKVRGLKWVIEALNAVPIKEKSGDSAAIREILARLEQGDAVLIFPEGSRTPDGEMREFKRGIAVLVKRARCAVVPVAIDGAFDAWPRTRATPRLWTRRIGVLFGEPIAFDELMEEGAEKGLQRIEATVRELRRELRERLAV
jgi:1-acyl-sn-glycerol-3-phosphate acyltransferase